MYYYFDRNTNLIQQQSNYLIYNIVKNQFHLVNEGLKMFLDFFTGEMTENEIVKSIINIYQEPENEVKNDFNAVVDFLICAGYLHTSKYKKKSSINYEFVDNPEIKLVRAQVKLTNKCNLKCSYCFAEPNGIKKDISADEWIEIFNYWKKQGLRILTLTGGEPFVRKDIFKILDYLNKEFIIEFNTNATLIDEDIAERLSRYNIKTIMVSLDSMLPEKHDKYRGVNSWNKALKGIENLKKYNLPITISTTFTNENEDELDLFLAYCKENDFNYNPDIIINIPGNPHINEPKLINQQAINEIKFENDPFSTNSFNIGCQATIGFANFSNTGKLKPCDISDDFFEFKNDGLLLETDSALKYHKTDLYKVCCSAENKKQRGTDSRCIYNCNLSNFFKDK